MDLAPFQGAGGLLDFVPHMMPKYLRPNHVAPLADFMARAAAGEEPQAVGSFPPRHAKTETIVVNGIPWYLGQHPDHTCLYVTYGATLAEGKSAMARDVARRMGLRLRTDSASKSKWLLAEGGGLDAVGRDGPITGYGYKLVIVDDPYRDRAEAESPVIRAKVNEWYRSTLVPRMEPGCAVLVMMQRWHQDDLIGYLSADEELEFEVINVPAIQNIDTPNEVALWPEIWPLWRLKKRRRQVGEYPWWSQYQGQPRPRGKQLFREPARYTREELQAELRAGGYRLRVICDPAATAKTAADHSAIGVFMFKGYGEEIRGWVLDMQLLQVETPELAEVLKVEGQKWRAAVGVEAVAGFKAVPQMLRKIAPRLRVFDIDPLGDKFTRALPGAAAWNRGDYKVPVDAPWVPGLIHECQRFTGIGDEADDQVDTLAHAWNEAVEAEPIQGGHQEAPMGFG